MSLLKKKGLIAGKSKSPKLFYQLFYERKKKVKATLLFIHGMQEYSDRYLEIAEFFAKCGFAVLTYDQLGHGRSVKYPEDLGYFQESKPAKRIISDALHMHKFLIKKFKKVPHFILGHSMGSFVLRSLLQRKKLVIDGAIIVGTAGRLPGIRLLKGYFSIRNKKEPRKRTAFNSLFSRINNRKFAKEEDQYSWLSLSTTNRKKFAEDPFCDIPFTNNGFYTLFSLMQQATKRNWAKHIPKSLSLLFVSGEDDSVGNYGKGVTKTVNDLKSDGFEAVYMKLYPDCRHEILNEDIREEVFETIYDWIKAVIDGIP